MLTRNGKQYQRVNQSGAGHANSPRTRPSTARFDIFFEAVKNDSRENLVRAWRGKKPGTVIKELERYYVAKGYQVTVQAIELIEDSFKK